MVWTIEASESSIRNPDYFVDFSAGRCFLYWSDEIEFAKKFNTKEEAEKFAAENRVLCGIRIASRKAIAAA